MHPDYLQKVFSLDGKKAIVTGGNSGIGKGIAVSLALFGADVTIIGRDKPTIEDTVDELAKIGSRARGFSVDVGNKSEIDGFFDTYYQENDNKLDILISNAGIQIYKQALETSEEEIERLYSVNFNGAVFCCRRASEAMKKQRSGNIVIVTSVNALHPLSGQAIYSSAKCALEGIMQCMAVELAPYGIRVNTLAPGFVKTNIGRSNPNRDLSKLHSELPLGRPAEPDDMGDVVACMVSDAFRYMTGSTVLVDGGLKLRRN